jgi:hypothetical protein
MTPPGFEIPKRFNGPPDSANGGYVCGLLAKHLGGTAKVRLKRPPPLETRFDLTDTADGAELSCGGEVVATARRTSLDLAAPQTPGFAAAEAASERFTGFEQHWFPHCFVCGPKRAAGDGLRIFPGALGGGDFAATWLPDRSLAGPTGDIAAEFLWAALDCPGAFAFQPPKGRGVLLGELSARIDGTVAVDEPCVLLSRELAHEGRKHFTASFLFGGDDELRAVAHGTWIEIA